MGQSQTALETELMGVLQKHPQIDLAILFGSHAAGRALPTSDLDLAVAANHQLGAREKMALIDDLALAAQCPVDLIDLTAVFVSGSIIVTLVGATRSIITVFVWLFGSSRARQIY